ncbi:NAD-dependent epimerase/dehydratase family protein [bacterium]
MKAIVTGSNGFVGTHVVKTLQDKGFDITCLVRFPKKQKDSDDISYNCINYHDTKTLNCLDIFKIADYVFHIAGVTKGITKNDFYKGNATPTKNLLETVKKTNPNIKRFVLISSLAATGPAPNLKNPKKENDENYPIEFYGQSKLEAEKIALEYSEDIPITIIRPSAVYGPKDKDFLNIFKMIKYNINIFHGNKNKYLSTIYIKDLAQAIIDSALSENTIGQIYNITNPKIISWKEFHESAAKVMLKNPINLNIPLASLKIIASAGEIYSKITKKACIMNKEKIKMAGPDYWTCSHEKALKDFGFIAKTPLEEGIQKTYLWYKNNSWL